MKTWRETTAGQASVSKSKSEKGKNPKKPELNEKTFSKQVNKAVASEIATKEKGTEEDDQFTKLRDAVISAATASKSMENHRDANETLRICAEHVDHQLPNEQTIATNILESIETTNPGVLSAVSLIRLDYPGMRYDFERAVTFLLPTNLVKKQGTPLVI